MWKLLETADVFLTNLRADALERLGLDPKTVRARLPRIVYASVTGYGLEGPERDRAGYDIGAFWARSGAAATLVPPTEVPPTIRSGYGDHTTGLTVLAGLLGALLERERTGEGRLVEVSLLGTGIYCMGWDLSILLGLRQDLLDEVADARSCAPRQLLQDGRRSMVLAARPRGRSPLARVVAVASIAPTSPRTSGSAHRWVDARTARRSSPSSTSCSPTRTFDEWVERFDAHDVWWAPVNTLRDVLADPQANAAGMFVEMAGIDGEQYKSVSTPVRFEPASDHVAAPGRVPTLGEHTAEVLAELGLS